MRAFFITSCTRRGARLQECPSPSRCTRCDASRRAAAHRNTPDRYINEKIARRVLPVLLDSRRRTFGEEDSRHSSHSFRPLEHDAALHTAEETRAPSRSVQREYGDLFILERDATFRTVPTPRDGDDTAAKINRRVSRNAKDESLRGNHLSKKLKLLNVTNGLASVTNGAAKLSPRLPRSCFRILLPFREASKNAGRNFSPAETLPTRRCETSARNFCNEFFRRRCSDG